MGESNQPAISQKLARSASPSFRLQSRSLNSVRLRRVFDLFDCDGDGEITISEICGALDRLGLGADPAELESTVSDFIRPGAAGLSFEDFAAFHTALGDALLGDLPGDGAAVEEEVEMREAFEVFDDNRDGFISARELQKVLEKLGLPDGSSIERVQQMIGSVDENHDGRVDFAEFRHMMSNIIVNAS